MGIIQKQTLQGTFFTYAGIGLGFVTVGVLMPRIMTKAEIGLVNVAASVAILMAYLANLGLNGAGGRYFTYFRDYDRQHNGFLLVTILTSLTGFALSVGLLLACRPYVLAEYGQQSSLLVQHYYLLIPLTFFTLFFNVFDNYAKLLYDTVTGTFLQQFALRLFILGAVSAYGLGLLSFEGFLYGWLGAYGLQMLLMGARVAYDRALVLSPRYVQIGPAMRRDLIRYASLTLLTGLSTQVILHIDKIMVNDYAGLADAGLYSTCSFFGTVIAAPATALYKVSGVIIADAWKTNDLANIARIYRRSCLSQLVIGGLVFVGIAANLPTVFRLLLPGFEAGYYVILWIGFGKLIDMATGVNGMILNTSRYYVYDSAFFVILVALTIVLTRALLPIYGLTGPAVAAAAATALFNAARTGFVWATFGLQPFSWRNAAVVGLILAVWGVVALIPYQTAGTGPLALDLVLRSALITALYVGALFVLRLDPSLNELIGSTLTRFRRRSA